MKLCLYGNGWDKHPLFARFARGQLEPGERLNAAYNGSRINLHIHNEMSMHQRLVEGALAGGFFLVNRLDPERDYEPVESYFEPDREIVYFETGEELREKCRYYLEHEDERIEIAARMRQRALSSYTVEKISESVLDLIRSRIQKVEVRGSSFRRDYLFQ